MRKVPYDTNKGQKKGRPVTGTAQRVLKVILTLHIECFNSHAFIYINENRKSDTNCSDFSAPKLLLRYPATGSSFVM